MGLHSRSRVTWGNYLSGTRVTSPGPHSPFTKNLAQTSAGWPKCALVGPPLPDQQTRGLPSRGP